LRIRERFGCSIFPEDGRGRGMAVKRKKDVASGRICYLCGRRMWCWQKVDRDHVVPKQFIKRKQPRTKGFDYAGVLPTHHRCNNTFGGLGGETEVVCQKALRLIQAFSDPNQSFQGRNTADPDIEVTFLSAEDFADFSEREKKYFGITDVGSTSPVEWSKPGFFKDKAKVNPMIRPMNAGLSVLVKCCAALLVKRHEVSPRARWRVLAIPCHTPLADADLGPVLGDAKPFEIGVRAWVKLFQGGGWVVTIQHEHLCVFLFFAASSDLRNMEAFNRALYKDYDGLYFESRRLLDLAGYQWTENRYSRRKKR
jgi:hypothetical protein